MKEAELRLAEIRRQRFEFERDVVKPLEKNKGQMDVEKVLSYIQDGIHRKVRETPFSRPIGGALRDARSGFNHCLSLVTELLLWRETF